MNPEQIKAMSNDIPLATDQYIQDLLQQLGELEAEKAEILEVMRKLLSSHRTFTFGESFSVNDTPIEIEAHTLIQKHAKK